MKLTVVIGERFSEVMKGWSRQNERPYQTVKYEDIG